MSLAPLRQAASLALSLLLCVSTPAQQPQLSSTAPNAIVRPDPKRAQKLVERGEKAEADGHFDEALLAYDEAARLAPQNLALFGRSAALRSRLGRAHVERGAQVGPVRNPPAYHRRPSPCSAGAPRCAPASSANTWIVPSSWPWRASFRKPRRSSTSRCASIPPTKSWPSASRRWN